MPPVCVNDVTILSNCVMLLLLPAPNFACTKTIRYEKYN